jgi:alpha-beta hydrolase superfamily lysophospholipase
MLELKRPPQNVRREIIDVDSGGEKLALHLWEAGARFADNDIAFFVLDRRGSGISPGDRHDIPDAGTLMEDYRTALHQVRESIGEQVPLTLFGHCLGGSFLAALLHEESFTTRYDAVVFCSTWLGRMHATLGEEELAAVARDPSRELWDARLKTEDFTDDAKYRRFIDHDDLATRHVTRRSRATLLELERRYLEPARALPDVPSVFVSGMSDPIIDLDSAYDVFARMVSQRGTVLKLPTDKHYLFFTKVGDDLIDWASTYTLLHGVDHGA